MSKRYNCCLGASTTAGGVIVAASGQGRIEGRELAVEGDPIHCPACNRLGRILCVPPRTSEIWHGKQAALEGDLCICQCEPPPKLIANQQLKSNSTSEDELPPLVPSPLSAMIAGIEKSLFNERFQLHDDSGAAAVGANYMIERASGEIEKGVTDAKGFTHILSSTNTAESIKIYFLGYDDD